MIIKDIVYVFESDEYTDKLAGFRVSVSVEEFGKHFTGFFLDGDGLMECMTNRIYKKFSGLFSRHEIHEYLKDIGDGFNSLRVYVNVNSIYGELSVVVCSDYDELKTGRGIVDLSNHFVGRGDRLVHPTTVDELGLAVAVELDKRCPKEVQRL